MQSATRMLVSERMSLISLAGFMELILDSAVIEEVKRLPLGAFLMVLQRTNVSRRSGGNFEDTIRS